MPKYPRPTSVEWRRVLRKCKHVDTGYESPCWIYTGAIDRYGYGRIKYAGANRFTHRVAYRWAYWGEIDGFDVDHACKQRACCNPDHVRLRSQEENRADQTGRDAPLQVNRDTLHLYHVGRGDVISI